MSHTQTLTHGAAEADEAAPKPAQKRRIVNAVWQPFVQFKLLMYMLGTTALVAVLLGAFLYYAFSDLVAAIGGGSEAPTGYYGEMARIQLVHLFRYCGALFVLYVLLLATVCIAYTHRLIGPLRPFSRHVEALTRGDFSSRVNLRRGDLDMYVEYAERLNQLAVNLETRERHG